MHSAEMALICVSYISKVLSFVLFPVINFLNADLFANSALRSTTLRISKVKIFDYDITIT